jgi:hypothetical protein
MRLMRGKLIFFGVVADPELLLYALPKYKWVPFENICIAFVWLFMYRTVFYFSVTGIDSTSLSNSNTITELLAAGKTSGSLMP